MLRALLGNQIWFEGILPKVNNVFALIGLFIGVCVIGYLLGSINTAIIVSKVMYGEDIRTKGSGNAGMTNIMRTYGKGPAAITFIGDLLKTLIAMTAGTLLCGLNGAYFAGLFAVLGHIAPLYYGFKGGKGVAATAMFILYADPFAFLILLIIFVLIVWGLKYLSLGSIISAFIFPYIIISFENTKIRAFTEANPTLTLEENPYLNLRVLRIIIMLLISFTVIFMHRSNIKRLASGTESKFRFKKTQKPAAKNSSETEVPQKAEKLKPSSLHNIDKNEDEDEADSGEA